ncbi:MAG: DapH/DapD/GlmU-related protein [Desulfomonilia bacterium]
MKVITSMHIAQFLGKTLQGEPNPIFKPANLSDCGPNDIVWVKSYTQERLILLEKRQPGLAICDMKTSEKTTVPTILSENPRLDFIRVLNHFYLEKREACIHPTAIIEKSATVGKDVTIGAYAYIGHDVLIGDGCNIGTGVVIEGKVCLGNRCVIKSNAALGGQGFGFEYDEYGNLIHFPHLGSIITEDDVWIGSCSTVEIGTLGATRIFRGSKIDDLVQVGHNVTVGRNTLIMANTVLCGGCSIGERCWIAPNSVIKEKVNIGDNVTVGLGSVVLRDVEDGVVVAGVPAKPLQ